VYRQVTESRDSSVVIATGCGLDDRMIVVRFPAGAGNFSLHHRDQAGPPSLLSNGSRGLFPSG
jgi:hypothetical protein